MPNYLLCAPPIYGHVAPMITLGQALVERGARVTLLTGTDFRDRAVRAGLDFRPLPVRHESESTRPDSGNTGASSDLAQLGRDIVTRFIDSIPDQWRAVEALLAENVFDAIIGEAAFTGLAPYLLKPRNERLPTVGVSTLPVMLTSVDTAPFGSAIRPGNSPISRLRNRVLNTVLANGPLRPVKKASRRVLRSLGAPASTLSTFDFAYKAYDELFQLSVEELEYPRRELPDSVHFVGPLRDPTSSQNGRPNWWSDLNEAGVVVHVSQGTLDNKDFSRLLVPTLRALESKDVLVVATTGGAPLDGLKRALGDRVPDNARLATFVSYPDLLPRCDVFVTNGGFGGVQQALSHGVPLVVAGSTEDKPEVAARVAWAGCGVDLRTGTPTSEAILEAVTTVLRDSSFGIKSRQLRDSMAMRPDPADVINIALQRLIGRS